MKSLRYMPIAFVAGVHGFLIFAPYAAVVLAARMISKRRARARLVLNPDEAFAIAPL